MEKRKHQRVQVEDLLVDIADGTGFFQGQVSDISQTGICVTDASKYTNGDTEQMTIMVSGKGVDFKMNVRPRWYTHGGERKTLGVEITVRPMGWSEFVTGLESDSGEDVSNNPYLGAENIKPTPIESQTEK